MPESSHFRIGTRGSDLALWQAHHVRDLIAAAGGSSEIIVLSTQGDREQVQAFEKLEGKGFFTKEIEEALLDGRIDVAVHSHKDLETRQPPGLAIVAVPQRASQRDALLIREDRATAGPWLPLPPGAVVGTSSVRRRDQLLLLRPDLNIEALRGNVPTRVQRLQSGRYDAIVLAEAGLDRLALGLEGVMRHSLDPRVFVPAPAQGALALQMREDDPKVTFLSHLTDPAARDGVHSERSVLRALEGGCQLPFGAHWDEAKSTLRCFLQTTSGPRRITAPTSNDALLALRQNAPLTVHITRAKKADSVLQRLAQGHGMTLVESSMIDIEPIPDPTISADWGTEGPDWVWIGSPGAGYAVLEWLQAHPSARIAVPGHGTASSLATNLVARIGYVGQGEPQDAWNAFAHARTSAEHVAIPHGTLSMKRWEETRTEAQLHPWEHYHTVPGTVPAPASDVVCFTSPSNVQAWTGPAPTCAVAIGPSTSAALNALGWQHITAESSDAFGIWEAILRFVDP